VRNGIGTSCLSFSTSLPNAYQSAKRNRILSAPVVMIAIGTPSGDDGSADTSGVMRVAREIAGLLDEYTVAASKSTVPVGTSEKIAQTIEATGSQRSHFDVVSNPEFLKEGAAVEDFMRPSRIIVGSSAPAATQVMLR
jgi:UDPglucose 6-dehydrogenase